MPPRLLADLAVMMSSSAEDLATRALELLVLRSPSAATALNRLLEEWRGRKTSSVSRWVSQVVGRDGGRTDLEGYDSKDGVIAILENKFWAGLTDNQPATYLQRLPTDGGLLVFVAPSSRVALLAHELGHRLDPTESKAGFTVRGESHVSRLPSGRALVVTSWTTILHSMGTAIEAAGEYDNLADLRQIQGLVERMDIEGFRPFTLTDLTGDTPRLIMRLCSLTDGAVQVLLASKRPYVNRNKLRASAGQGWYGHYLKIHGHGCQLIVSAQRWSADGLSPVWFRVSDAKWQFLESLRGPLLNVVADARWIVEDRTSGWSGHWLPIRLLEGRERDIVVGNIVRQVEAIVELLGQRPALQSGLDAPLADPVTGVVASS